MPAKAAPSKLAKISSPVLPEIIERPRLYRLLDAGLDRAVTWVSGPAGCGKKTLVASYLKRAGLATLWYQVDPGDADPASLFHFLRLAIGNAVGGPPTAMPVRLMPEHLASLPLFARRYFREAFAALPLPFTLVFDNLQEVPADAPFLDLLSEGLQELPASGHVILVSRHEPDPAVSRVRAARQLSHIGWSDLRFEVEEAGDLMRLLSGEGADRGTVVEIAATANGWAAGPVLLADPAAIGAEHGVTFHGARTEDVFDYFAAEVLRKVEVEQRDFLLTTALLPTLTPQTAESLTGNERSADLLANLNRRNFFTPRRAGSDTYEYHPLFRGFLQREAQTAYSVERLAEMRCAAIDILVKAGHLDEAVALIRECSDWPRLVRLLEEHASGMLAQARHRTLEAWLAPVPEGVLEARPWLRYWLGAARAPTDPVSAEASLARVFRRFQEEGDSTGAYQAWATISEIIGHSLQYTGLMDRWIDELEGLRAAYPEYPSEEMECRITTGMLMALAFHRPFHPELSKWRERGQALAERVTDIGVQGRILLALYHTLILAPNDAERAVLLDRVLALCARPDAPDTLRVPATAALAGEHCHAGRHPECLKTSEEALALAERSGIVAYDLLILARLARSAINRGDFACAREALERIEPLVQAGRDASRAYYHILRAYERYLSNDTAAALAEASRMLACMDNVKGLTVAHVAVRLLMAHLLAESGRPEDAAQQLQPIKVAAAGASNPLLLHHCLLCEAEIALSRGETEIAVASLGEALPLGRNLSISYFFPWHPMALARLCALALEHRIETEEVQRIIRERGLPCGPEARHLERWPRPLRVYTLGAFAILRHGERLSFSGRAPRKPLDLLQALIAFGGSAVRTERLLDALWPDADGDAAHTAFETTLHRLRKLLGVDGVLVLTEGRLTLSPELCWVDALAVKDLIARGQQALAAPASQRAEVIEGIAARLSELLSAGGFLDGVSDEPWVEPVRTQVARGTARILARVADRGPDSPRDTAKRR